MIARSFLLAVCVAVLSPGLPHAQEAAQPGVTSAAAADSTADRKMYEDIEILRRILDRKLHTLYPPTSIWKEILSEVPPNQKLPNSQVYPNLSPYLLPNASQSATSLWTPNAGQSATSLWTSPNGTQRYDIIESRPQTQKVSFPLEGVYLKGQGVVYTATLPTLQASTKVKKPAEPISEWESVRREFRKEKETPKKPDEVGLREVLLKVLAENGHHFSWLGENESLTIVVTVHEESKPRPSGKSVRKQALSALTDAASGSSKAHDQELLGDLHLKQGRYEDAIIAFREAVVSASDSKQKATAHRKLAQAYLMQEKNEKARSHLDQAIALLKEAEDAKNKPAPASKPEASPLPVKMIISVPKKLLDQAGEGKMTFEEFCRRANVETLRFEGSQR